MHQYSDAECLDLVDEVAAAVEYIFKELKTDVAHRKAFADRVKKIQKKLSEPKSESEKKS